MKRTLHVVAASVMLLPLTPVGQEKNPGLSVEQAQDLRVASLPESQDLYCVQYGLNTLLLFQWSGETLRLVNMEVIGN